MQTFLPYPDMIKSLQCLDDKRLGKQRVEAMQIINALEGNSKGWTRHPATLMWKGYLPALKLYHDISIIVWINRGFRNNMKLYYPTAGEPNDMGIVVDLPDWWGDKILHASHKSNLLRKDYKYYHQFGWNVPKDLPYVWPVSGD